MKMRRFVLLLAALSVSACSSTALLPGRCDSTSDCAPGLTCNLDRTLEGNGRCVAVDGAAPDGAAGSVGDGLPDTSSDVGGSAGTTDAGGSDGGPSDTHEVKPGCASSAECPAASPICGTDGVCRGCNASSVAQTACATLDPMRPTCSSTGACVECGTGPDCKVSTKPICGTDGVCRACNASNVAPSACATLDPTHPTCASTGACVVCSTSADCGKDPTKPICDATNQRCVSCTTDSQCVAKVGANPGVCMSHQDGRCATDAETFYVVNQAGCSDVGTGPTAGTAAAPFCSLEPAAKQAGGSRNVVVLRGGVSAATSAFGGSSEVSIIAQQAGVVISTGATGVHVAAGDRVYLRDVSLTAPVGVGVVAEVASTLRMEHVTVSNSTKGGILLAGAAFDISNSTISGNGPGSDGAILWGGILVQGLPATGPQQLRLVTVTNNQQIGVNCTGPIAGTDVFASGNQGGNINPSCGFSSCAPASSTCGATP